MTNLTIIPILALSFTTHTVIFITFNDFLYNGEYIGVCIITQCQLIFEFTALLFYMALLHNISLLLQYVEGYFVSEYHYKIYLDFT